MSLASRRAHVPLMQAMTLLQWMPLLLNLLSEFSQFDVLTGGLVVVAASVVPIIARRG